MCNNISFHVVSTLDIISSGRHSRVLGVVHTLSAMGTRICFEQGRGDKMGGLVIVSLVVFNIPLNHIICYCSRTTSYYS